MNERQTFCAHNSKCNTEINFNYFSITVWIEIFKEILGPYLGFFVRVMVLIPGPSLLAFIQISFEATEDEVSPDDVHVSPNRIRHKYRH
jgi:hypothetical protein